MSIQSAKLALQRDAERISQLEKTINDCESALAVLNGTHEHCKGSAWLKFVVSANDIDPNEYPHNYSVNIPRNLLGETELGQLRRIITAVQNSAKIEKGKIEARY